ncbi:hypothetical protein [Pseudomonas phage vB_Pa-PAC2]
MAAIQTAFQLRQKQNQLRENHPDPCGFVRCRISVHSRNERQRSVGFP